MKLYVCYGTWQAAPRPGGHPCGTAYHALKDAGHDPEVKHAYGVGAFPGFLNNLTSGRREVKKLTGSYWVPVLVLDDGTVIQGSREIASWAQANPPGGGGAASNAATAGAGASDTVGGSTAATTPG